ncbi:serine hydrolase domain-containing protein [Kribbella sp.]|uniref:serine hydrolase domain-containing protein n=1 Tax=Kribbella sp. TaxID=1871183 RepID=UPI002D51DE4E|nr:serine hydrolase domain-containing protein [Kribbella sp.]HZX05461.1 serine hydrolase domain-containing protein [Kribbella sp.]
MFSAKRLTRLRAVLERRVESGAVPGVLAVLARRGEVHIEAVGRLAFESTSPEMAPDTIVRLASMSKPIVAACAMTLIEDCTLRLDDPIDDLVPELANMRVLADPAGPLEDTVAAERPISVRDVLAFTLGTGMPPEEAPIAAALDTLRGPSLDEWIAGLGKLPLVHQPGERWMYDTGSDVTGLLIQRATGKSFGTALRERILEPLGMKDTGFSVEAKDFGRFATAYDHEDGPDGAVVQDVPETGRWSTPAVFEGGSGGLVSTAEDYLAFASAMLAGGTYQGTQVLSRAAVTLMTSDQLTPAQRAVSGFWPGYFASTSWGLGTGIVVDRTQLGPSAGSYGWNGFYGTTWYNDPAEELTGILIQQRAHAGDARLAFLRDFWTSVYQSLT